MKTKKVFTLILILLFICNSFAINLRGQVRGYNVYNGFFPYVSAQVNLYIGRNPIISYTDNYGMYYFYNIPPGRYTIQIGNYRFLYDVIGNTAWQDIPVVTF